MYYPQNYYTQIQHNNKQMDYECKFKIHVQINIFQKDQDFIKIIMYYRPQTSFDLR